MMPLAVPIKGKPRYVKVIKTEEKGSDVNLAKLETLFLVMEKPENAERVSKFYGKGLVYGSLLRLKRELFRLRGDRFDSDRYADQLLSISRAILSQRVDTGSEFIDFGREIDTLSVMLGAGNLEYVRGAIEHLIGEGSETAAAKFIRDNDNPEVQRLVNLLLEIEALLAEVARRKG